MASQSALGDAKEEPPPEVPSVSNDAQENPSPEGPRRSQSMNNVSDVRPATEPQEGEPPAATDKPENSAENSDQVGGGTQVGRVNGVSSGLEGVSRDGSRDRKPTAKGKIYQCDQAVSNFKSALSAWRKNVAKPQPMLSDCNDTDALRCARTDLELKANTVIDAYHCLTQLLPEPGMGLEEKFEDFEWNNLGTLQSLTEAIRKLEAQA